MNDLEQRCKNEGFVQLAQKDSLSKGGLVKHKGMLCMLPIQITLNFFNIKSFKVMSDKGDLDISFDTTRLSVDLPMLLNRRKIVKGVCKVWLVCKIVDMEGSLHLNVFELFDYVKKIDELRLWKQSASN